MGVPLPSQRGPAVGVPTPPHWGPHGGAAPPQVFSEYFKELEEESVRDNFVTVYELLDELMDFGFPQTTDSKILQECVGGGVGGLYGAGLWGAALHGPSGAGTSHRRAPSWRRGAGASPPR